MGSWLFSSKRCNFSACEFRTHPGAHRLVYVRRLSELNAFRKAGENRGRVIPSGNHTPSELPEWAVFFQGRPFFSRVGRFWNESAVFGTSRPYLERVGGFWNESPELSRNGEAHAVQVS